MDQTLFDYYIMYGILSLIVDNSMFIADILFCAGMVLNAHKNF